MKTKIITLESHDDLISVRDQLSWAKTPRILLVWPKYAKVTLRILDLKVLQRHADSLGAQLGLVTRRMKVRRDAESLGIPVFKSTSAAQREAWAEPAPRVRHIPKPPRRDLREMRVRVYEKESAWRTSLPGRIITFTFGVAAALALVILFVPRANVTIYPETRIQSVIIPISASEANQTVSITGAIPARKLSATVGTEQTLAITNMVTVPKSKSQGFARFTNLSLIELTIPAGTIISTAEEPRVRFVTLQDTLFNTSSKFVDVKIEAEKSGENGNAAAGAIKTVEGLLGLSLTVTNLNAINGGEDAQEIGASDEDRAKLREVTLEHLRREAETQLRAQIAPDDILPLDTFEVVNITEEIFKPASGQPGNILSLRMQVEFSARTISAKDLMQLSLLTLNSSIPNHFTTMNESSFKARSGPATDSSGVTRFEIEATRGLIRQVNTMRIFSITRGRESAAAKDELVKELSLRQFPEIVMKPAWWKWMPLIPFNVSVEVK